MRRCPKQNSVIRLEWDILPPPKFSCSPKKFWAGCATATGSEIGKRPLTTIPLLQSLVFGIFSLHCLCDYAFDAFERIFCIWKNFLPVLLHDVDDSYYQNICNVAHVFHWLIFYYLSFPQLHFVNAKPIRIKNYKNSYCKPECLETLPETFKSALKKKTSC